ncbi:UNKNOWN [Stylonychia lemnae]|uniref:Uncharacterized protein n=1 Tax=Stylonychia lemnae TaxID=5949 RepID=A0A078A2Z6_STYLE|nr:UNKNOWN [Stylonychia lemnae]|eukprot:CDW75144.1 UNKNOWN [Stylonychia lemnae]
MSPFKNDTQRFCGTKKRDLVLPEKMKIQDFNPNAIEEDLQEIKTKFLPRRPSNLMREPGVKYNFNYELEECLRVLNKTIRKVTFCLYSDALGAKSLVILYRDIRENLSILYSLLFRLVVYYLILYINIYRNPDEFGLKYALLVIALIDAADDGRLRKFQAATYEDIIQAAKDIFSILFIKVSLDTLWNYAKYSTIERIIISFQSDIHDQAFCSILFNKNKRLSLTVLKYLSYTCENQDTEEFAWLISNYQILNSVFDNFEKELNGSISTLKAIEQSLEERRIDYLRKFEPEKYKIYLKQKGDSDIKVPNWDNKVGFDLLNNFIHLMTYKADCIKDYDAILFMTQKIVIIARVLREINSYMRSQNEDLYLFSTDDFKIQQIDNQIPKLIYLYQNLTQTAIKAARQLSESMYIHEHSYKEFDGCMQELNYTIQMIYRAGCQVRVSKNYDWVRNIPQKGKSTILSYFDQRIK